MSGKNYMWYFDTPDVDKYTSFNESWKDRPITAYKVHVPHIECRVCGHQDGDTGISIRCHSCHIPFKRFPNDACVYEYTDLMRIKDYYQVVALEEAIKNG